MPYDVNRDLTFIHIPKCGGSSVEMALGIYGVNNSGSNKVISFSSLFGKGLQHLTHSEIKAVFPSHPASKASRVFAMVRHPVFRIASGFTWRKRWDERLKNVEVNTYIRSWIAPPEVKSSREWERDYRHLLPQVDFLIGNEEIYRLEDGLDAPLRNYTNLDAVKKINSSKGSVNKIVSEISGENIRKLEELYRRDYEEFSYPIMSASQ